MVKRKRFLLLTAICLLVLMSCRSSRHAQKVVAAPPAVTPPAFPVTPPAPQPAPESTDFAAEYSRRLGVPVPALANQLLISTIADWLGVPYRYGGIDKTGVDCSGFINNIYPVVYQLQVPRIAARMHAQAKPVENNALREGDLVFFRINTAEVGHAGILLFEDYFVHSTKSRGVMISRLREPYWSKYFVGGGRYTR